MNSKVYAHRGKQCIQYPYDTRVVPVAYIGRTLHSLLHAKRLAQRVTGVKRGVTRDKYVIGNELDRLTRGYYRNETQKALKAIGFDPSRPEILSNRGLTGDEL